MPAERRLLDWLKFHMLVTNPKLMYSFTNIQRDRHQSTDTKSSRYPGKQKMLLTTCNVTGDWPQATEPYHEGTSNWSHRQDLNVIHTFINSLS